ncbi:hypothetical protein BST92_10760 [Nonlabens arenilitoris]|uniref:VWFA domain-containing protein n=1 Tax=Nonlabens arenilitoris TaxID=1217969 RepID=A0A2S7UE38_9FLAO|nr:hypothetical protein BST92_10760 [Nonlabens arenilitoris]
MNKNLLFLLFILLTGCKNDSNIEDLDSLETNIVETVEKTNTGNQDINVSFLLDLSDRINPKKYPNPTMDFYERDAAYIRSVSTAFYSHLRGKKVRLMNDKIQVFFDPEPLNQRINKISSNLKFSFTRKTTTIEKIRDVRKVYDSMPVEIYKLAIADDKYIGSDTWKFFKTKVKDYCIEKDHRNILVVLTDGYIYHKDTKFKEENKSTYLTPQTIRAAGLNSSKWEEKFNDHGYGFIPAIEGLDNLEVLVLGINPDNKNPYEEDVIRKYWSEWFDAMGIKKYEIKTAGLPANMDKVIKDFILK